MVTDTQRKKRIQPSLDYWTKRLCLTSWDISWQLEDEGGFDANGGNRPIARAMFNPPYSTVFLKFDREMVDACSIRELERVVIHELCHVMLIPYRTALAEYQSTQVGQALLMADEEVVDKWAGVLFHMRYPKAAHAPYEPTPYNPAQSEEN